MLACLRLYPFGAPLLIDLNLAHAVPNLDMDLLQACWRAATERKLGLALPEIRLNTFPAVDLRQLARQEWLFRVDY